jgi:hypothetical protein
MSGSDNDKAIASRVAVAALGYRLSALRLRDGAALESMRRSMASHGQ